METLTRSLQFICLFYVLYWFIFNLALSSTWYCKNVLNVADLKTLNHYTRRKRRRSDPVLWQNPLYQQKTRKPKDNTQTPPKTSITQRLRTDLGRSVGVTSHPTGVVGWGRYIEVTFTNRLYTRHVQVNKKVSEPSRSCHTGEFPDWHLTCVNLFDDPVKWYCNLLFISYPFRTQYKH